MSEFFVYCDFVFEEIRTSMEQVTSLFRTVNEWNVSANKGADMRNKKTMSVFIKMGIIDNLNSYLDTIVQYLFHDCKSMQDFFINSSLKKNSSFNSSLGQTIYTSSQSRW